MQARPYQIESLDAIGAFIGKGGRRGLVSQPTGTGKTNVFCWQTLRMREAGDVSSARPAVFLADREELLQQPLDRISEMDPWLRVGVEKANKRTVSGTEVIAASVQSVGRANDRLANITPGLVIIDECDLAAAESYHLALRKWNCFKPGGPLVLGFTATPKRLDKQALHSADGAVFQEIIYSYPIRRAIQEGYLCPIRGYRVQTDVDLDNVGRVGDDFNQGQLADAVDNELRTLAVIARWKELARERRTIVFCVSVAHAEHSAELWREHAPGIVSECVHGGMRPEERAGIMRRFKSGQIDVLTNVDIATRGFDVPEISCVVLERPTKSWARYMQMVGRGTRICEGKDDLIVIDVVDNCTKHSLATVPAILDLPPSIDLNGATLEEAAQAMDELKQRGAGGILEAVAGDKAKSPRNLAEVRALMERVDLLASVVVPDEVLKASKFAWIRQPGGGWKLNCGADRDCLMVPNALGIYELTARHGQRVYGPHGLGTDDFVAALKKADGKVTGAWKDSAAIADHSAGWRRGCVSNKQAGMLRFLGLDPKLYRNAGEASNAIAQSRTRSI